MNRYWPKRPNCFALAGTTAWLVLLGVAVVPASLGQAPPPVSVAQTASAPTEAISPGAQEVLRLAESGVGEEVITAYIDTARVPFAVDAADIIYLNDLGISTDLITAMLRHDTALREQGVVAAPQANPYSAAQPQPQYQPQRPPQPVVIPDAPTVPAAPVYVSNAPQEVTYFYDSLAPYGTWVELEGQGWCWQPRAVVVDRGWQPYWQGGRWIYSDSGWYWHSDYSWGWAPFHYGRWQRHPQHGWVWFPELQWAPAWVSWRVTDSQCGWAPLPRGASFVIGQGWRYNNLNVGIDFDFHIRRDQFRFVELRHMNDRHPNMHALPSGQMERAYRQGHVVNNRSEGPNGRFYNHGVAAGRVAAASGREIRPVTVQVVSPNQQGGRFIGRERLVQEGGGTVLYRPEPRAQTRSTPVVAQRIDERQQIIRAAPQRPAMPGVQRSPVPRQESAPVRTQPTQPVRPREDNRPNTPNRPEAPPVQQQPQAIEPRPTAPSQREPIAVRPSQPVQPVPESPRVFRAPELVRPVPAAPRVESPKAVERRLTAPPPMQRSEPVQIAPRSTSGQPSQERGGEERRGPPPGEPQRRN